MRRGLYYFLFLNRNPGRTGGLDIWTYKYVDEGYIPVVRQPTSPTMVLTMPLTVIIRGNNNPYSLLFAGLLGRRTTELSDYWVDQKDGWVFEA